MAAAEPKPSLVERLFAEHRAALQAFFLRRIRAKADAPDLAQEVYVRMLRISDQEAIRNPVHYLYTVANNLVKEHAVLDRRPSGIDINEAPAHEQLETLPEFDGNLDATQRERAHAAAPEAPRRGGAALHAGTLLPGDRDAPRGVPADGEEVRGAGLKSLSTPHGGAGLNL
jgi:DNA-directed RNA polymerase specialized sigma24 family protein